MHQLKRYCAKMMYLGTHFNGYQIQPNYRTIQGEIEKALSIVCKENIQIVGCGRTDTGVSAKEYFFHFDTHSNEILEKVYSVNGILDRDIVIQSISSVDVHFHARFSATKRGYEYRIHTSPNPFIRELSYFLPLGKKELDKELMSQAAQLLLSYSDFNSFCKAHSDVNNTLCKLYRSEWEFHSNELIYHIEANRFLRGMVRLTVGTLLNIGFKKVSIDELIDALEKKQKLDKSWSVPSNGLYLNKIVYSDFPDVV